MLPIDMEIHPAMLMDFPDEVLQYVCFEADILNEADDGPFRLLLNDLYLLDTRSAR